jgi:hypothetical protein
MGQSVHIEIEVLATKDLASVFKRVTQLGSWSWVMSYSPTQREALGFNAMIEQIRPLPKTLSKSIQKKIDSWSHQQTTWWCDLKDFLDLIELHGVPVEVSEWYLNWGSAHLGLIGKPHQLRIIIWIAEGSYD